MASAFAANFGYHLQSFIETLSSSDFLAVEKQIGLLSEGLIMAYRLIVFVIEIVPLAAFALCVGDIVAAGKRTWVHGQREEPIVCIATLWRVILREAELVHI